MQAGHLYITVSRLVAIMQAVAAHVQMNETTWTSWPNWFWYPGAIHWPFAPLLGIPRMRTNMKPDVMTSEVRTMPIAQAQRERRTGSNTRTPERRMSVTPAAVPYLPQSTGAL